MRLLFLFLGATLGLFLGYRLDAIYPLVPVIIFSLPLFLLAYKRKQLPFFAIGYVAGFLLSLIPASGREGYGDFSGMVVEVKGNYFLFRSGFSTYYVYEKDTLREVGDFLTISGRASPYEGVSYEGRFDFGEYLYGKGVRTRLYAYEVEEGFQFPIRLRKLELAFLSNFSGEAKALLDSILFNRKDYQSESIQLAASLSLISLFSASGMLHSLLMRGLKRALTLRISEKSADLCCLIASSCLLPFAGGKLGIYRVYLTLLLRVINNRFLKDKLDYPSRLAISGLTLILINRFNAYQSSFLLGYGIAICLYYSRGFLRHEQPILGKIRTTLFIYLFILPATLSSGTLHLLYPLFSFISLPLVGIFALIGGISFVTLPFTHLLDGYASFLLGMLKVMSGFDFSFSLPLFSGWETFLYYALLLICIILHEFRLELHRDVIAFGTVIIYCVSLIPIRPALTSAITFINVGQGDSCLIQDGLTSVLIDTGGNISFDMAEEVLIPYLRKRRVYRLDALIITHDDYDHAGAKDSLVEKFPVGAVLGPDSDFPYQVGDLSFDNLNIYGGDDENSRSVVTSLELMGKKWLFMGDAPEEVERKIIEDNPDLDCDILKVGHHGSDTSSCKEFLEAVTPEVAIISCGRNNSYGHPSEEVVERLEDLGIAIRRTDLEGSILYESLRL